MIIPTIFAHNKKEFNLRLKKLLPVSKNLQIDFMDGKFVPAKSVQISQVPNLKKYKNIFEAHLMTLNPDKHLKKLKSLGFTKVIFHFQEASNPQLTIQKIRMLNLQPWIAINPEVRIKQILPLLPKVNGVLFMGVHPGKEKQSFISSVYEKIRELRKIIKKISIQVDGGADEKIISKLAKLGVGHINSGSYVSSSENPKQAYKKLSDIYKKYRK